jgi:hypothetical protein
MPSISVTLVLFTLVLGVVSDCPAPLHDCSGACYLDNLYCCPNGVLTQKQFCGNDNNNNGGNGDRDGQYGRIETGDRWGSDIGSGTASSADDCQAQCFR